MSAPLNDSSTITLKYVWKHLEDIYINRSIVITSEIVNVKLKYTTLILTAKINNRNRSLQSNLCSLN